MKLMCFNNTIYTIYFQVWKGGKNIYFNPFLYHKVFKCLHHQKGKTCISWRAITGGPRRYAYNYNMDCQFILHTNCTKICGIIYLYYGIVYPYIWSSLSKFLVVWIKVFFSFSMLSPDSTKFITLRTFRFCPIF